jgi:2-oxoglutarate ferredoxin oxidoreductase subunit beta
MTISPYVYLTDHAPTWCPGCGDFGIWMALKDALSKLGYGKDDVAIVYDIGCNGNMYNFVKTYSFVGLHGRTLPAAQGIKMANHNLPVIVVSGDGGSIGEGGNHFIHAAKRNPDITVILHDNQVYGLTTGQAAPTAKIGFKSKSTPDGATDEPLIPLTLAMTAGASFVSRGFAGDTPGLSTLIQKAIQHKGFSLVDVLQPCVTFNKIHSYAWYRQRIYELATQGYTPDNKLKAYEKALEWGDHIPVGIFYEEDKPTSESWEPALKKGPLASQTLGVSNLEELLSEYI